MVTLCCAIVGDAEGRAFPVDIDGNKLVGHLKYEIQKKNPSTITCDAKDLQLFLAKSTNGDWVREDDPVVRALEEGQDHPDIQKMLDGGELSSTRRITSVLSSSKFSYWLGMSAPTSRQVHMLVRLPETRYGGAVAFPALESRMRQSILRFSWGGVFSAIALVVDRTVTHVYLLTNLHVWIDEADTYAQHLSGDFQTESQRYVKLNSKMKSSGGETRNVDGDALERKTSPRSTESAKDPPRVVVEQLLPDASALAKVYEFTLDSDICWRSSADFNYAIFELPVTREIQHLTRCQTSIAVHSMMDVDMFGFSDARQDENVDQPYAIIPARTTGWSVNKMRLSSVSAPRFSGGAIVCTKWGVLIGYVDGGFDRSTEGEHYQSYGYTFHGLPADMPSLLPLSADEEDL